MAKTGKSQKRQTRRDIRRELRTEGNVVGFRDDVHWQGRPQPREHKHVVFQARSEAQGHYRMLIESRKLIVGYGSAGTGKTHTAVSYAAEQLIANRIRQIVLVRPIFESKGVGAGIGFLPGTLEEKCAPHLAVLRGMLSAYFTDNHLDMLFKREQIVFMPLEFMRGHTIEDAVLVADEMQNCTVEQMKLLLTRIGERCTVILNGDTKQMDIRGTSGLADLIHRLPEDEEIGYYRFAPEDVIRSGLAKKIVQAYEKD